jgi:hypothetical protein
MEPRISFWQKNWGLTAGLLFAAPIMAVCGLIVSGFPFEISRITSASGMVVEFASFTTAAWTFGFAFFWPSTEENLRNLRLLLVQEREKAGSDVYIDDLLRNLRIPFWAFLLALLGIVLLVLASLLAIGAVLYSFGPFLLAALVSLSVGFVISIGTWIQFFQIRGFAIDAIDSFRYPTPERAHDSGS